LSKKERSVCPAAQPCVWSACPCRLRECYREALEEEEKRRKRQEALEVGFGEVAVAILLWESRAYGGVVCVMAWA
jgi:hypothetical protein